ncbi:hypothetical protein [Rhodococcus sp. KB6]|uniref:hypothetical protein n=1 Tax=Rhodococcus sp. KB6 TaxID=1752066 RepID=UPI000B2F68D5|nr:hypothetical protein [Rhodococcus sp. KB6]
MTESRIEKLTRIGQEMAAAVAEMRADAADVTSQNPETAALVEELSVTCDRWSQWEEVAAVALTHLQSAGRLIPAGGMALTAEEWADVQTVSNCAVQYGNIASRGAAYRLAVRFPATEPAEDGWGDVNPNDPQGRTYRETAEEYYSAPAEPAEEETKADPFKALHDVISFSSMDFGSASDVAWMYGIVVGWDNDDPDEGEHPHAAMWSIAQRFNWPHRKVEELRNLRAEWVRRTSSPVVPAPTETGPWQTWQEAPEGVQYYGINGWGPTYYVNRDGVRYRVFDGTPSKTEDYVVQNFAPFVAAEEGRA